MTDSNMPADQKVYYTEPMEPLAPPSPTEDLEDDADKSIRILKRFTSSQRLDADLRIALTEIMHTIKSLKTTVIRQNAEAQASHEKMVEILKSNTPNRRRD